MTQAALRLYVRVSTNQQELDGQLRELQDHATVYSLPIITYAEKVSGKSEQRHEYNKLLREAAKGDHILVWSLDRFSRAERFTDAMNAVLDLEQRGVIFHSLKEPMLDTPTEANMARDVLLSLLPVISKWEAKRRSERTQVAMDEIKAGRRKTKSGRPVGRPVRVTDDKARELVRLRDSGLAWSIVANRVGLKKGTCTATYSAIKGGRWKWRTLEKVPATQTGPSLAT